MRGARDGSKIAAVLHMAESENVEAIVLNELKEPIAAFRLRCGAALDGWSIIGSSRVHKFGGGIALMVRRRSRFNWHGGAQMRQKGAEVVCLRGRYGATGVTLIGAYVTPNRSLTDTARVTKVTDTIRNNTLKAIASIAETARERGDCVALLGDLNIGFSDGRTVC